MRVVTAPEDFTMWETPDEISVFLAGGITNCWKWQDEVIKNLEKYPDTENLVVINPRRENFPIHDPNASYDQIKWEFNYLNRVDIFSMYFTGGISDQPICMYELGRYSTIMISENPADCFNDKIIISIEADYKRRKDVEIQMDLAYKNIVLEISPKIDISEDPKKLCKIHARKIYDSYKNLLL